MFKNAMIYRSVTPLATPIHQTVTDALQALEFAPCGTTQEQSIGWAPPRGEDHGALIESIGGHWILKLATETKKIPAQAIRDKVDEQCKTIEAQTGRKPGRKERRELSDDARLALLPNAFPARHSTLIWIDPASGLVVVDASSQSKADAAITCLIKTFDGLALQYLNTNTSPATAMSEWLSTKEAPVNFSIDRECELKAADESKAVVKYGRHALDIDEVAQHIAMGKVPTRLAMTWNDRVSFVLTEGMQIKKIKFLDTVFESTSKEDSTDLFDADVTIMTGELLQLIPDLTYSLGSEA